MNRRRMVDSSVAKELRRDVAVFPQALGTRNVAERRTRGAALNAKADLLARRIWKIYTSTRPEGFALVLRIPERRPRGAAATEGEGLPATWLLCNVTGSPHLRRSASRRWPHPCAIIGTIITIGFLGDLRAIARGTSWMRAGRGRTGAEDISPRQSDVG
jgi:hypothetical protein